MTWKHVMTVAVGALFLLSGTCSVGLGAVADAQQWCEFGDQVLCFVGGTGCSLPAWLDTGDNQLDVAFALPGSTESVHLIDRFLGRALQGYELESRAVWGRIPLHFNPDCIFGLYLASEFAGTELGRIGRERFSTCVEHGCLRAIPDGSQWMQRLQTWLDAADGHDRVNEVPESFQEPEVPFLLAYLADSGSSHAIRLRARARLAAWLQEHRCLEPALRQRSLLLTRSPDVLDDAAILQTMSWLDTIGAVRTARQVCEAVVRDANSPGVVSQAARTLAQALLSDSIPMRANDILALLEQRSAGPGPAAEDVKNIVVAFRTERDNRSSSLIDELLTTQREERAWQLCQCYAALWGERDLVPRWHRVIERAVPGSLALQYAQLFLARSLVRSGEPNEATDLIGPLCTSLVPRVKARAFLLAADVASSHERIAQAIALSYQASAVERATVIPTWFRAGLPLRPVEPETLTAREQAGLMAFLRAYNELIDGDFGRAIECLESAGDCGDLGVASTYVDADTAIAGMLMLGHMGLGDRVKAQQHGMTAVRALQKKGLENSQIDVFLSEAEKLDSLVRRVCRELRTPYREGRRPPVLRRMIDIHANLVRLDIPGAAEGRWDVELLRLLSRLKHRYAGGLLAAEYALAKTRLSDSSAAADGSRDIEPVLFCSQLIQDDYFEGVRDVLSREAAEGDTVRQMYRLARYAKWVHSPHVCRLALDSASAAVGAGDAELIEGMARMYLDVASHQKAIDLYEKVVEKAADPNAAQRAQLAIIEICAEQLDLYDKALQECQDFLKRFSGSPRASEVEFLIGKLAYLTSDYTGAVGQLDSFQRRYPDSPHVGQAMMFAAVSRMSEGITEDAIDRFTEIIGTYPNSDLAARSKLLIGYAQVSGQKYSQALETFRQLVEQYPKSQYVERAKSFIERLSRMSP